MMKQEDKQFLAELARELNTQDNAGTANPIWCIMEKEIEIVSVPDDCGDFKVVTYSKGVMLLEDFAEEMTKQVPDAFKQEAEEALCLCTDTDELRDVLAAYTSEDPDDYCIFNAREEDRICRDATGFLTKKSAEEHLKQNAHHYSKEARAYALSAWRNPVYEKLINIIKTTNWEEEV